MSKSNDTSKLRELRDDELQEVSGGWIFSDVMVESIVSPRDPASGLPTGKRSVF
jgi:bacteriocin-like protein